MLVPRRGNSESFYIVFSDLLFCTMLIFLMLFVMILAMVRPIEPQEPQPPVQESPAVELVVAIDISGSMQEPYDEMKRALLDLGRNFPRIVDNFSIGIVAYRLDHPNGGLVFPLTEMNSRSVRDLQVWLDRVSPSNGAVDPAQGLDLAVQQFSTPASGEKTIRSLVIIGDVGPFEYPNFLEWDVASSSAQSRVARALQITREFSDSSETHQVLSMYTYDPARYEEPHRPYSEQFFCQIGEAAGTQGLYTKTRGSMMWILLESFLPQEDSNQNREPVTCS
jgi:hypothetical protein